MKAWLWWLKLLPPVWLSCSSSLPYFLPPLSYYYLGRRSGQKLYVLCEVESEGCMWLKADGDSLPYLTCVACLGIL